MKDPARKRKREAGQAAVLVLLAMSVFLVGAVGLAIDGSHLYAERQMAQAAADAGAQAGIRSIYTGSDVSGNTGYFSTSGTGPFTCATSDTRTPCYYAQTMNGFNTSSDTVTYDFPAAATVGVSSSVLASGVNLLRVTVARQVPLTLFKFISSWTPTVQASATGAITSLLSPIPILVLHPTLPGSFSENGSNSITITGGPTRSIQVNSSDSGAVNTNGNSWLVDLSQAGPNGTGADFGAWGGPSSMSTITGSCPSGSKGTICLGTLPGAYTAGDPPIQDPLSGLSAPPQPTTTGSSTTVSPGTDACPANLTSLTSQSNCTMYSPGYYATGINLSGVFAIFRPGIYYINHNGFQLGANTVARMANSASYSFDPTSTADPAHTTWTSGMLVYNSPQTPVKANKDYILISANSGQINNNSLVDASECGTDSSGNALGGNCLVGANGGVLTTSLCTTPANLAASYYGVLFFQDHTTATSLSHSLAGGGGLSIKGTIYLTHTVPNILSDGTYQSLTLNGNSGSTTKVQGEIIVDALTLSGGPNITMNLTGLACYTVRQLALVQ